MTLTDSISVISGIGPLRQKLLEANGIGTVRDLLCYLPYRYEDSTNVHSIPELYSAVAKAPLWEIPSEKYAVVGVLQKKSSFSSKRGFFIIKATFIDAQSAQSVDAVWFNQEFKLQELKEGSRFLLFGKVVQDGRRLTMQSPQTEILSEGIVGKKLGRVSPIYRRIKTIRSPYIARWITSILSEIKVQEFLTFDQCADFNIPKLDTAFMSVHSPSQLTDAQLGRRRLEIQELLELKQSFEKQKTIEMSQFAGESIAKQLSATVGESIKTLPFSLTDAQEGVVEHCLEAIAQGKRLDTFVYGDVGSGKTIVALLLARAFASIGKSTIMAVPTTILAAQHSIAAQRFGVTPVLVTSKQKLRAMKGEPTVYIGTHALLSSPVVQSDNVALVVIDEQHRFGVVQREQLAGELGRHVVTLSATPIPRTLALSFLGFSDSQVILERPVGRKEIITKVVPTDKDEATYDWIAKRIEKGEQVYLVFPRIENEEDNEKQSLLAMATRLKERYFPQVPSALLYGSLKEAEKVTVMEQFRTGKIKLLFSTSVIEVGVDVPQATTIAIHGADLFGLAQLHQLRGRVGRSDLQGYCFLFPSKQEGESIERLAYFSTHHSGIDVAEYDLKNRGSGQLLGTDQAGLSELRIASLDTAATVKDAMELYKVLREQGTVEIPHYILV